MNAVNRSTPPITLEDCERRCRLMRGAVYLTYTILAVIVVGVGWSLAAGYGARSAAAEVAQELNVYQARQDVSMDSVRGLLLRIETGIDTNRLELKDQRRMIEMIMVDRHISTGSVRNQPGGGPSGG